jgi:hypothetical protein
MQELLRLLHAAEPHILVHGHSHKYSTQTQNGILYLNPGAAGPARFRLPRTAALLELKLKAMFAEAVQACSALTCHIVSYLLCVYDAGGRGGACHPANRFACKGSGAGVTGWQAQGQEEASRAAWMRGLA